LRIRLKAQICTALLTMFYLTLMKGLMQENYHASISIGDHAPAARGTACVVHEIMRDMKFETSAELRAAPAGLAAVGAESALHALAT
jgi:hypothetical protein